MILRLKNPSNLKAAASSLRRKGLNSRYIITYGSGVADNLAEGLVEGGAEAVTILSWRDSDSPSGYSYQVWAKGAEWAGYGSRRRYGTHD